MKDRKIDPIAKIAMRSRGLTVKEKRVRFQGEIIVFKYNADRYDVYINEVKVGDIVTNNINDAIATWKQSKSKV
jgi:ACT domain-containing protein